MGTAPQHARAGLLGGAALLLVLLGVLAMHGLGGHGNGHPTPSPTSHHAAAASPLVTHAGHAASEAAEHLAAHRPAPPSWVALCLAVLAGAVLVALAAGRAGGVHLRSEPSGSRARLPGRRDRDPPSLVLLSVRRC